MEENKKQELSQEDWELELQDLIPPVRLKAEEILAELIKEGGITKEAAVREAIAQAEEWWMNLEG